MNSKLEEKAKVALDLLNKGADEVIITDTDLKVKKIGSGSKRLKKKLGTTQIIM
jgi:3-dehydroquinate synthase class II